MPRRCAHLTGGKKVALRALLSLCNGKPVEVTIDGGATIIIGRQGAVINGVPEIRMRNAARRPSA
jgi:hypothetical protein